MGEIIGSLIGSGVAVAFVAFILKKALTLSKLVSSWSDMSRAIIAYSVIPILAVFIYADDLSASIPYFIMAVILFLLDRYRASKKNTAGNKQRT